MVTQQRGLEFKNHNYSSLPGPGLPTNLDKRRAMPTAFAADAGEGCLNF